jgi:hypothetical protein
MAWSLARASQVGEAHLGRPIQGHAALVDASEEQSTARGCFNAWAGPHARLNLAAAARAGGDGAPAQGVRRSYDAHAGAGSRTAARIPHGVATRTTAACAFARMQTRPGQQKSYHHHPARRVVGEMAAPRHEQAAIVQSCESPQQQLLRRCRHSGSRACGRGLCARTRRTRALQPLLSGTGRDAYASHRPYARLIRVACALLVDVDPDGLGITCSCCGWGS